MVVCHKQVMVLLRVSCRGWVGAVVMLLTLATVTECQRAACRDEMDCSVQGKFQCQVYSATNHECDEQGVSLSDRPGPPSSIKAVVTQRMTKNKSLVKVTVGTPMMGLSALKGFYFKVFGISSNVKNKQLCWFMNLTNRTLDVENDVEIPIEVSNECLELEEGEFYIKVQSSPKAPGERNAISTVITVLGSISSGFVWKPWITASVPNVHNHSFNARSAIVLVLFSLPDNGTFKNFRVQVRNQSGVETNVKTGRAELKEVNLCGDNITIKITPIVDFYDTGYCLPCRVDVPNYRCDCDHIELSHTLMQEMASKTALCATRIPSTSERTFSKTSVTDKTQAPTVITSESVQSTLLTTLLPSEIPSLPISTEMTDPVLNAQTASIAVPEEGRSVPLAGESAHLTKILVPILSGVVCALALVLVLVVYKIRHKVPPALRRWLFSDPGFIDGPSTLMKHGLLKKCSRKRILLVAFRSIHGEVQRVIKNFIEVMRYSRCDVHYHEWKLEEIHSISSDTWFRQEIFSADWVVFVHSEEAFHEVQNVEHMMEITSNLSCSAVKVLTDPQSQHVRKILNVRFKYTEEKFYIERLVQSEARYCITENFYRLAERIHNLESQAYNWSEFCRSLPEGSFERLEQSVDEAEAYLCKLQKPPPSPVPGTVPPRSFDDLGSNFTKMFKEYDGQYSEACKDSAYQQSIRESKSDFRPVPPESLSCVQSDVLNDDFDIIPDYSHVSVALSDSQTSLDCVDTVSECYDSGISNDAPDLQLNRWSTSEA